MLKDAKLRAPTIPVSPAYTRWAALLVSHSAVEVFEPTFDRGAPARAAARSTPERQGYAPLRCAQLESPWSARVESASVPTVPTAADRGRSRDPAYCIAIAPARVSDIDRRPRRPAHSNRTAAAVPLGATTTSCRLSDRSRSEHLACAGQALLASCGAAWWVGASRCGRVPRRWRRRRGGRCRLRSRP